MAVTYQTGTRLMANVATKKPDLATLVALEDAAQYPLYAILSGKGKDPISKIGPSLGKKPAYHTTIQWFQDNYTPYRDQVSAQYTDSATTVEVDHGSYFVRGDIVLNETRGDLFRVESVSSNDLTVKREIGDVSGVQGEIDDYLRIVGSAFGESSAKADAISTLASTSSNYEQIFKTLVSASGDNLRSKDYGQDDIVRQERKKAVEHAIKIEQALWFGQKGTSTESATEGSKIVRTLEGIIPSLSTYVASGYGTTLSETEWNAFLSDYAFKKGPKVKYLFAGTGVLAAINTFARNQLQAVPADKTWGIAINNYISPYGKMYIIHEPLFDGSIYKGYGVVLSPKDLLLRPMKDTTYERNIQTPGTDAVENQFFTELSLQLQNEPHFAAITGITSGYAAS